MLVIGVILAILTVLAGALLVVSAVGGAHRARAAADLSALAAAAARQEGRAGCPVGRQVADRNGARLSGCVESGPRVDVEVAVDLRGPLAGWGPARARAGAGPAPVGSVAPAPAPRSPSRVTPARTAAPP